MFSRRVALASIAAGAVAIIAIPSAFAAGTTYKISAGSTKTGTAAYKGKTPSGTKIAFKDTTTNLALGCDGGTASGVITLGSAVPAAKAATIKKTTWKNCVGPQNLVLVPTQVGTWYINGKGKTVKGKTPVFINHVKANVKDQSTNGALCSFTVTGAVDGKYSNSTHKLAVASTSAHKLTVSNVTGCFGLINNKDNVTFKATYAISSKLGAIKIQSN